MSSRKNCLTGRKKGVQIFELELEEFQEYSKLIKKDVLNYLDPSKTVLTRTQHGGTSPSQVKKAINKAMKKLRKEMFDVSSKSITFIFIILLASCGNKVPLVLPESVNQNPHL